MKSPLLLALYIVIALAFLMAALLGVVAWSRFGKSFDPIIAFTANDARRSGNAAVTVPTEHVISLYQHTVALRDELGTVYLSLATASLLFGAMSIGMALHQLRAGKKR